MLVKPYLQQYFCWAKARVINSKKLNHNGSGQTVNIMAYEDSAKTAERQPDFGAIFSNLRQEVNKAIEIAHGMNYLGNNLKPMLQNKENVDPLTKEEPGIIGMLWAEIYKLRDANNQAELTMNHIKEVVGS